MVNQEEKQPDRELLNIEYQECVSASRFVVGTRFNYFVSFTTLFLVLIGGFYYIWAEEEKMEEEIRPWLLLAIALFGLYVIGTVLILEQRAIKLYRSADNRASKLEQLMGIQNGIRQIFVAPEQKSKFLGVPLTHTVGIGSFYWFIALFWASLVLISGYQSLLTIFN